MVSERTDVDDATRAKLTRRHSVVLEGSHVPLAGVLNESEADHGKLGDVHADVAFELDLTRSFSD